MCLTLDLDFLSKIRNILFFIPFHLTDQALSGEWRTHTINLFSKKALIKFNMKENILYCFGVFFFLISNVGAKKDKTKQKT